MMKQSHYKWLKAGIICSVTGAILIFAGYLNVRAVLMWHMQISQTGMECTQ